MTTPNPSIDGTMRAALHVTAGYRVSVPAISAKPQSSWSITGNPDDKHVSTSYAERANLTMRMHMRRFTRLTNAFSKKIENHTAAVALHSMYYNFARVHQTLKVSPAMAAAELTATQLENHTDLSGPAR